MGRQIEEENYIEKDQISFGELSRIIWAEKQLITFITIISIIGSIAYALMQQDIYKSSALVSIQDSQVSGVSSVLSQYSVLSEIAGIKMPSGSSGPTKTSLTLEIIKSRIFFKRLINKNQILPELMALKNYDKFSKKIIYDDAYDDNSKKWTKDKPSFYKSYESYLGLLDLREDPKTKLISISVDHQSPIFAHFLVKEILNEINFMMRERDILETDASLEYLQTKVIETQVTLLKQSYNNLIISLLEKRMMADIRTDYALRIIDPPLVPEFKYKPERSKIVILSTIFGFFVSIFFILIRHFFFLLGSAKP